MWRDKADVKMPSLAFISYFYDLPQGIIKGYNAANKLVIEKHFNE